MYSVQLNWREEGRETRGKAIPLCLLIVRLWVYVLRQDVAPNKTTTKKKKVALFGELLSQESPQSIYNFFDVFQIANNTLEKIIYL
jgi:hypothetical protein